MKKFLLAIVLLWLGLLPALARQSTILIVGDSLSAGYGIEPQQGWVNLLQQRIHQDKFPYQVINASISGDTTSNGLQRLPVALAQAQPEITIIELGGNDGLRGLAPAAIQQNLTKMIQLAKRAQSKVLLLGVRLPPNYGPVYLQQFAQVFTTVAHQQNVTLVTSFLQGVDDNPLLMQNDGIHPRATAQQKMLDNVWPGLQSLLEKKGSNRSRPGLGKVTE